LDREEEQEPKWDAVLKAYRDVVSDWEGPAGEGGPSELAEGETEGVGTVEASEPDGTEPQSG